MENFQVRIFINHFFTQMIELCACQKRSQRSSDFSDACNRFCLQTLRTLNSFFALVL